jgi:hypothetical protein
VRIYIPATLDLAVSWKDAGGIPADATAFAVTEDLIDSVDGDEEEREFAASVLAADESLVLLATEISAPRRRVVLAADAEVTTSEGAEVALIDAIPWKYVAAILVDDASNAGWVAQAVNKAQPELLDELALLWYATVEVDALRAEQ